MRGRMEASRALIEHGCLGGGGGFGGAISYAPSAIEDRCATSGCSEALTGPFRSNACSWDLAGS
jgi:hypothetical protein